VETGLRSGEQFERATFEGVCPVGGRLAESRFEECTFVDCVFAGSTVSDCEFAACVFRRCDLGLVKLPRTVFRGCGFQESKIIGVNWAEARWPSVKLHAPLTFSGCLLDDSTFLGLDLGGVGMTDCVARRVDFRDSRLNGADFTGTDLEGSLFVGTDLTDADLSGARNYSINAAENVLRGARFSLPEALALLVGLGIVLSGWDGGSTTDEGVGS